MYKKIYTFIIIGILIITSVGCTNRNEKNNNVFRLSGKDVYEINMNANKYFVKAKSNVAVLSNPNDFKHSFYSSYIASSCELPYYMCDGKSLSSDVKKDLLDRKIKRLIVVGNKKSISENIDYSLSKMNIQVDRIYDNKSKNSYSMNNISDLAYVKISELKNIYQSDDYSGVMLINDNRDAPLLLSLISFSANIMKKHEIPMASINSVSQGLEGWRYIVGSYDAVDRSNKTFSGDPEFGINTHYRSDGKENVEFSTGRIGYSKNYKEAADQIARSFEPTFNSNPDTVVLINPEFKKESLSSGIVASSIGAPILLVDKNTSNEYLEKYIKDKSIKKVILIGGDEIISPRVERKLSQIIKSH